MDSSDRPFFHEDVPILHEGERIFDLVRSDGSGNQVILTGGAKLEVSGAEPGYLGFLEVDWFDKTPFGPNRGEATALRPSSVVELSDEIGTGLRYSVNSSWFSPTRGPIEHDLLGSLTDPTSLPQSVDVCFPGYDPKAAVSLAVELLLNADLEGDVGLYIPGTQSHWGNKSDVREEFSRYALARSSRGNVKPVSLEQLIPTAYVSQGTIKSRGNSITGDRLIVSKDLNEFDDVESPAYLIASHISRRTRGGEKEIERRVNDPDTTSVIRLWSPFTKRERDGAPKYGPHGDSWRDAIRPTRSILEDIDRLNISQDDRATPNRDPRKVDSTTKELPYPPTTTDVDGYQNGTTVTFEELDAPIVSDALDDLFSEYQTFKDVDYHRAAQLIFNMQMFFERLPTPVGLYDRWVQDRSFDGEIYLPKTSEEYIEDLQSFDMDAEGGSLLHAIKTSEQIAEILRDESPMFDRLVEIVQERTERGESIAIYHSSKKGGIILREALVEHSGIEESDLDSEVFVVDPDTARQLEPVDVMLFCGMQRPDQAAYYLHPRTEETVVFAYSDWIGGAVHRHTKEASDDLRSYLDAPESVISDPDFVGLKVDDEDERSPEPDFPKDKPDSPSGETTPRSGQESMGDNEEPSQLGQQNESTPEDLTERDLRRLQDIADLEPTKNGELVDEWGYDSGSDLYQYLSSNIDEFYERNSDKYIILSEKGREAVSDL